jgi:hypothetical protein
MDDFLFYFIFLAQMKRVHYRENSYKYIEATQRVPGRLEERQRGSYPPTSNPYTR